MLTKRLTKIVDAIPKCRVLADVGCDHGYIGIEALKRGKADRVIFTDISDACLQKARKNCPEALKAQSEFMCLNGLGGIACDAAAICGMGGLEILSILQSANCLPNAIVLQPMRNIVDTRKYVAEHYTITYDVTVYDGKFYTIITAQNAGTPTPTLTDMELNFGITNINNPDKDFMLYLQNEQAKLTKILGGCKSDEAQERLTLVNKAMEQIRRKL